MQKCILPAEKTSALLSDTFSAGTAKENDESIGCYMVLTLPSAVPVHSYDIMIPALKDHSSAVKTGCFPVLFSYYPSFPSKSQQSEAISDYRSRQSQTSLLFKQHFVNVKMI